jgi:hypothetical protein
MAEDNTGTMFIVRHLFKDGRGPRQLGAMHINPAWYECPECGGDDFGLLVDMEGPTCQYQCRKCKAYSPPWEMHLLQATEKLAKKWPEVFVTAPDQSGSLVLDLDIAEG